MLGNFINTNKKKSQKTQGVLDYIRGIATLWIRAFSDILLELFILELLQNLISLPAYHCDLKVWHAYLSKIN